MRSILENLEPRELGKYFEQLLIANLIKLKIEVYTPVLDVGIDLVLRKGDRHLDFQVKSVRKKGGRLTIRKDQFPNRENLFLVFFNVKKDDLWEAYLIPANDVHRIFHLQTQGGERILRLNATAKDLETIEPYRWNLETLPR